MNDLLTTKQLQDYLKVDRTTIYRMLKDGRLVGIRVGNQWRFAREAIDALMSGEVSTEHPSESQLETPLPIHCIQPIQDVFADIAQVGSLTTAPDGAPLTTISNSCHFCSLILGSESGRLACIESWRKLASQSERRPQFVECHAGLHYARARIEIDGKLEAMAIAGQFYAARPDQTEENARLQKLAVLHGLDVQALQESAKEIRVVDKRMESQIGKWLEKIAHTFEQFGRERSDLMGRLRRIAAMTDIHS
jgi:excisionase family DNA binding protein